jgi:hypothetical protein
MNIIVIAFAQAAWAPGAAYLHTSSTRIEVVILYSWQALWRQQD